MSCAASKANGVFTDQLLPLRENVGHHAKMEHGGLVGNPDTYGDPDGHFQGKDAKERPIEIFWWKQMHVKDARWLDLTIIRVLRPHATNKERDPRESWFV